MRMVGQPLLLRVLKSAYRGLQQVGRLAYRGVESGADGMGLIGALLIYALGAMITLNVIMRSFTDRSIGGITDFASIAMVIITFIGLAYTQRTDGHVRVRIVTDRLSPRVQRILMTIVSIIAVPFLFLLVYYTARIVERSHHFGSIIADTATLVWVIQLFIPLGIAMWALVIAIQIKDIWKGK